MKLMVTVCSCLLLVTSPAHAAIQIFMVSEEIKGESKNPVFPDSVEVESFTWGVMQQPGGDIGGGGGSEPPIFDDFTMTKFVDDASADLMIFAVTRTPIREITWVVRRTSEPPIEYLAIRLTDVFVSDYSVGGSGGETPITEQVTFKYGKVEYFYRPQKDNGSPGDLKAECWDLVTNSDC